MIEDEINNFLGSAANPLMWPNQTRQVSDYNYPYLQTEYFPYLLPYSLGDVTMKNQPRDVSLTDGTKHLLWYCIQLEDEFNYPFAEDERWMYWAQNTSEHHQFQTQRRVYLSKSPEDSKLTTDELEGIIIDGNEKKLR